MANLPYLTAALICDRVLQEQDGTLSAIRIVDRVRLQQMIIGPEGQQPPEPPPPIQGGAVRLAGLVSIKRGKSDGKFTLAIVGVSPSEKITPVYEGAFEISGGEDGGQNVVLNLIVASQEVGLHWFDIRINGDLATRIPLVIEVLPQQAVSLN